RHVGHGPDAKAERLEDRRILPRQHDDGDRPRWRVLAEAAEGGTTKREPRPDSLSTTWRQISRPSPGPGILPHASTRWTALRSSSWLKGLLTVGTLVLLRNSEISGLNVSPVRKITRRWSPG